MSGLKTKFYKLDVSQFIELPIKEVFPFFANPNNLKIITPNKLQFIINNSRPIIMKKGQLIDYQLTIRGIPIKWCSLISYYDPPNCFIDEQIRGPYLSWHHTHTFKEHDNGTTVIDHVKYSLPLGLIGRLIHYLWVRKDLEEIFNYRKNAIRDIFNNNTRYKYEEIIR